MILDNQREASKWAQVQARMNAVIGAQAYESFFATLRFEEIVDGEIHLSIYGSFLKKWIDDTYAQTLIEVVRQEWPQITRFDIFDRKTRVAKITTFNTTSNEPPHQDEVEESGVLALLQDTTASSEQEEAEHSEEKGAVAEQVAVHKRILIEEILKITCAHYRIGRSIVVSSNRKREIVRVRQVAMFLAKNLTDRSLPEIGRRFGGRDHTTVLHSVRKVYAHIKRDVDFAYEVAFLEATLRGRILS